MTKQGISMCTVSFISACLMKNIYQRYNEKIWHMLLNEKIYYNLTKNNDKMT